MYANYAVWGGGSGGPEDDFFSSGSWYPPAGRGNFFLGGGFRQCNVTYKKNAALRCGCSVPAAE